VKEWHLVSPAGEIPALVFRVSETLCALPSAHVIETMRALPIVPLDQMPAFTLGMATIRGAATPIVDIGALLGAPASAPTRFVTVRAATRVVALAVDEVIGLSWFDAAQFTARPALFGGGGSPLVESLAMKDNALHLVLNATRLLPGEEPAR
jgi:purine-binding chemotaxis protein CheW